MLFGEEVRDGGREPGRSLREYVAERGGAEQRSDGRERGVCDGESPRPPQQHKAQELRLHIRRANYLESLRWVCSTERKWTDFGSVQTEHIGNILTAVHVSVCLSVCLSLLSFYDYVLFICIIRCISAVDKNFLRREK